MHLLKWQFQPTYRTGSWHLSIRDARRKLEHITTDSLSLQPWLREIFADCYADARGDAAAETHQPITTFPPECPYTLEQVHDPEFLPEVRHPDVLPPPLAQEEQSEDSRLPIPDIDDPGRRALSFAS